MINFDDLGLIFIYVFVFGISDFFVKKYVKSDNMYLFYYISIGLIGCYLIQHHYYNSFI